MKKLTILAAFVIGIGAAACGQTNGETKTAKVVEVITTGQSTDIVVLTETSEVIYILKIKGVSVTQGDIITLRKEATNRWSAYKETGEYIGIGGTLGVESGESIGNGDIGGRNVKGN